MNNIFVKLKELLKKIPLIKPAFNFFYKIVIQPLETVNLGLYTTFRTLRYSRLKKNTQSWKASMRVSCHIIEKGLTMPEKRLGFGQNRVYIVANEILIHEDHRNLHEITIAVGIIKEYDILHKEMDYALPNRLQNLLNKVVQLYPDFKNLEQIKVSKNEYFSAKEESFPFFARSRRSIRHFSSKATTKQIDDSIKLALTAPSACNRQAFKCHVFNDKEKVQQILAQQNGNRGFGHLIPQVFVLTVDLRMIGKNEQNDIYFNAGLFAMNLCYAFHYNMVGSCMLNWSVNPKKDKMLRKIANIPDPESITVIIAFGIPNDQIEIARSDKKIVEDALIIN